MIKQNTLQHVADNVPNIDKWVNDGNIDNNMSNSFWKIPHLFDAEISQLLTF